jgi:signal peptidase II
VSRQRLRFHVNFSVVLIALVVGVLDALTKVWARHVLASHVVHLIGFAWLRLQYNSGISFSINKSGPLLTGIVTIVVAIVIVVVGLQSASGAPTIGFGLLLGGGVANVINRLAERPHQVTDFVALGSFPVFNLADVAITAGFVILLVAVLRGKRLVGS